MPARAKFSSTARFFIKAIRSALTKFLVDSISGTCTVTMSAFLRTSSIVDARSTLLDSCQACRMLIAGSKPSTFMPSA